MTFAKSDKNINRAGRPRDEDRFGANGPTRRQLKERELLTLLRKIKPHVADAIFRASKIMGDEQASHQNQLKASTILLDLYRKLVTDMYDGKNPEEDEQEAEEIQRQGKPMTTFSLTMVKSPDDK